jgi:hypothetical protein
MARFIGDEVSDSIIFSARYPNFSLDEFLITHGIEWRAYDAADHKEYAINCPECTERGEPTPDTHKKLWINTEKGGFVCYRCTWSGSMVRLVQKISNCTFENALKVLKGSSLDPLEHLNLKLYEEKVDLDVSEAQLVDIELPYGYEPIEGPHPYLEKRGIPWKYASLNDWGYSTVGYTKDRIIVPTFMDGRLVFWQARATWELSKEESKKKVLNPKGYSARSVLYNYDIAKEFEEIVIVEGFIDSVKAGPNSVATNGKRLHPQQAEWLARTKAKKIVLAWDADAWSDERKKKDGTLIKPCSMKQATDLLRAFSFEVRAVLMPPKRDPGSFPYGSPELKSLIDSAKSPKFTK